MNKHEEAKEDEFNFNFGDAPKSKGADAPAKPKNDLINLFDDLGGGAQPQPATQNNNQNDFFSNMNS